MSQYPGARRPSLALFTLPGVILLASSILSLLALAQPTAAFDPWWVQAHRETGLWSGLDSQAVSFGTVPQGSYFLVSAPQQGNRLYVWNPLTSGYAYIDAAAVRPSSAPPDSPAAAAPRSSSPPATESTEVSLPARGSPTLPPGYQPWWVSNFLETEMWSGPGGDSPSLGAVPQFRRFMVVEPQSGDRLRVWSPENDSFGYLDAATLGPSGASVWMDRHSLRIVNQIGLPARSVGDKSYVRNLPVQADETELRWAPNNTPVDIAALAVAPDGTEWYTVGGGGFVRASEVRLPRPVDKTLPGRWVDADLSEPTMITGYEGDKVVYSALAIKGTTAFATPQGTFRIWRRVENETMDSSTLNPPIPRDTPEGYYLKDVLYTQYFTYDGASLHYNYWLGTFGRAGSHGCLGLNLDDAKWLWDWAALGTPVVIR